jgi:hypothetical protein
MAEASAEYRRSLLALEALVLGIFLRLAPRWSRWRKEERTVTLDFGCDESCDLPDMRGSSVIFVNVHVQGARNRYLLGQQRNELWAARCEESGQYAKPTSRQSGVELRQETRTPDAGFDIGSDRIGVIERRGRVNELRGEQQLFDKADEGVLLEILHCDDRRRLL